MAHSEQLAAVARLIGDPARARILSALMEGRALTAGELAREAGVTPQTVSSHLARLQTGGLIAIEAQGRHRYARLADAKVARALEALGLLRDGTAVPVTTPEPLRFARTCYDHLAGRFAVELADALERSGHLVATEDAWEVTDRGVAYFQRLGIDLEALARGRRPLARRCLDWSERRPHLAGALGSALADRLFALKWVARRREGRGVRLTVDGQQALARDFRLAWAVPESR